MTTRRTRTLALAAAFVSVGLLSACGGAEPGVAARVGDQKVSVNEVNRLSLGFCDAVQRELEGNNVALPMNVISGILVRTLAVNAAVEQLAADYGVEPSSTFVQNSADAAQNNAEINGDDAQEAALVVQTGAAYRDDLLTGVGRASLEEEGVTNPTLDDSLARGNDLLARWLEGNDVDVDPQYHVELTGALPGVDDTSVSFAVSSIARDGAMADDYFGESFSEEQLGAFTAYARDLPESQRCG